MTANVLVLLAAVAIAGVLVWWASRKPFDEPPRAPRPLPKRGLIYKATDEIQYPPPDPFHGDDDPPRAA
jgi:hypothetical protein